MRQSLLFQFGGTSHPGVQQQQPVSPARTRSSTNSLESNEIPTSNNSNDRCLPESTICVLPPPVAPRPQKAKVLSYVCQVM